MSNEEDSDSDSVEEEVQDVGNEDYDLSGLNIGKDQIKLLQEAFTAFDYEKKGVLGTEMIGIILELLGHSFSPEELEDIISEVDADGSGELEFNEFCILASQFLPEDADEENAEELIMQLKEAFRFYDKNETGYITTMDFYSILRELDPELPDDEIQGMIYEIDQDDSGTIDFDEFVKALT